jgi:hypothetical protein
MAEATHQSSRLDRESGEESRASALKAQPDRNALVTHMQTFAVSALVVDVNKRCKWLVVSSLDKL